MLSKFFVWDAEKIIFEKIYCRNFFFLNTAPQNRSKLQRFSNIGNRQYSTVYSKTFLKERNYCKIFHLYLNNSVSKQIFLTSLNAVTMG